MTRPLFLLLACLGLVSACAGSLSQPDPGRSFHVLAVSRPADLPRPATAGPMLTLDRLAGGAPHDSRELVWRTGETTYVQDYYHRYLADPLEQVAASLRDWLAASGLFSHVVEPGSSLRPRLRLETSLLALHADARPGRRQAVAGLRAILLEDTGRDFRVLLDARLEAVAPLAGDDAGAAVQALNAALADCFRQLEARLAALPRLTGQADPVPASGQR